MPTTTPALAAAEPRLHRTAGIVRVLLGLFFVVPALTKFLDHGAQTALFERWGFPAPGAVVIGVGVLELAAGILLALGIAMPLPALVLAVDMVGALLTAGIKDGGERVVAPLVVLALLAFVLSRWGGAYQRGRAPAFIRSRRR